MFRINAIYKQIEREVSFMKERYFKRLVSVACTVVMVMGISVTTFAEEADTITTTIGETYYFDSPQTISEEEPEVTNHLIFL